VGDEGSEFHREVIFPGMLRLLGPRAEGQMLLDVACGQGAWCRVLHRQGLRVVGVDAARALIEKARQHNATLPESAVERPQYHVADARELDFLPQSGFIAATCVLAIQNIDALPPVFAGIARALQPGGRLIVVMMHPCFRGPKATSWGWDDDGTQYRRVDRYLIPRKEPIITHPGKKTGEYTWTFHRPLQTYVRALRQAGLLIDAMEEWTSHKVSDSGPRAPAENKARQEIPMFMAVRAVKVEPAGS
jgi:ubiquinone/menaquinone biosynthesis C-methylase UbiE